MEFADDVVGRQSADGGAAVGEAGLPPYEGAGVGEAVHFAVWKGDVGWRGCGCEVYAVVDGGEV